MFQLQEAHNLPSKNVSLPEQLISVDKYLCILFKRCMCLSPKNAYSRLLIFFSWICFELMESTFLVLNVFS